MITEKVLSVGEIRKANTSDGNYAFTITLLKKGLNGLYKSESNIFKFKLVEILKEREKYLKELEGGIKEDERIL